MSDKIKGRSHRCGQRGRASAQDDGRYAVKHLRVNADEDAIKWLFHRAPDSTWRWRKTSPAQGLIAESADAFASYSDCVTDAKSYGYHQWLAPAKLKPLSFSHLPGPLQKDQRRSSPASQSSDSSLKAGRPAPAGNKKPGPGVVSPRGNRPKHDKRNG